MIVNYFFKGLDSGEEKFVHDYLPSKLENIEKALMHFAVDAAMLNVNIERFEKHNAYAVELILKLPKKTIVAKEVSHTINKGIDFSKDRLLRQIRRHEASLRKEYLFEREKGSIRSTEGSTPILHEAMFVLEDELV